MSSFSPAGPPRLPQRSTPKRNPLQERTQSQTNEISSRRVRDAKDDAANQPSFAATPFPTKAAHVLLPSTIRKQKSSQNLDIFTSSSTGSTPSVEQRPVSSRGRRPAVRLKRSVKALRDLYEAQAEESRPSTAASSAFRPGTANSRLRSASSSEGLASRYAWEQFGKVSSDDLALLPTLPQGAQSLRQVGPKSSFASRAVNQVETSSPNFRILDATAGSRSPVCNDLPSSSLESSDATTTSPSTQLQSSSSPNVVRLAPSSSTDDFNNAEPEFSSPNVIKLGTSSPSHTLGVADRSSPILRRSSSHSSSSSRKRKRSQADEGRSFAARSGAVNPFPSSPPYHHLSRTSNSYSHMHAATFSSPPKSIGIVRNSIDDSSPDVKVMDHDDFSSELGSDQGSVADTHASLQAALSSSPVPPIQYPIVRAPAPSQFAALVIPKRKYRSIGSDSLDPRWSSRLSAVPSEGSGGDSKLADKRSSFVEDLDDFQESGPLGSPHRDSVSRSANDSQVRIVQDADCHEADDEVSALPGGEYAYRSPPLKPVRSTGYLASANSSQSRMNSMRNSMDTRLNSMRSYSHSRQNSHPTFRPDSSSSMISTVVVPTWARRYYSGFYNDSFQYLYGSTITALPPVAPVPISTRPETRASKAGRPSFASIRNSISEYVPSLFRPRNRPRLEARKSHIMPGVGPLVSNPVRAPATAALQAQYQNQLNAQITIRPVSTTLHPADPRAHWAGLSDDLDAYYDEHGTMQNMYRQRPASAGASSSNQSVIRYPQRVRHGRIASTSPHLHHDYRLNTGSTASRGYGFPFNRRSRYEAPSLIEEPRPKLRMDRRSAQVICFMSGFVLPFMWFAGALLPLPPRPDSCHDVEKAHWSRYSVEVSEWDEMDVVARLRLNKQMRGIEEVLWQNARWWRTLNRWMCIVGALILIVVIVLAVLGTRTHW